MPPSDDRRGARGRPRRRFGPSCVLVPWRRVPEPAPACRPDLRCVKESFLFDSVGRKLSAWSPGGGGRSAARERPRRRVRGAMNFESPVRADSVEHVVAIGASAGGLEALETFFDHLSPETGAAFVVITHLSPDFKSIMDELLARRTAMPVHVVEDGETLRPNCVYVIPPGKDMIVQSGRLFLTDRTLHAAPALPVDLFFGSLAREYGRRACAVILSGTGADGARGARAMHAAGGLVIAQSLDSARFDGMPRAAAETGAVDLVLAPEAMGPALEERIRRDGLEVADPEPEFREAEARVVTRILELVLGGANVDFSEYKKTTVMRRIVRRMQTAGLKSLIDYLDELERNPAETRALAHDLLIVVTEFFRDAGAFDVVAETVIPELLADPAEDRPIRIWTPAVATGQEAYSIAMLLREGADRLDREPRVQIFATDVNPMALEKAAAGVYTAQEMAGVSAERRDRFFARTEDGLWQVAPEIRNWIVFAPHNMLRDPPFINTDLISCRNALIYFEPPAQQKSLSLFHFSLAPNGFLLLGPSESIGDDQGRFAPIDSKWRLFRKRAADRRDSLTVSDLIARNRWSADSLSRRRGTPFAPSRQASGGAVNAVLERFAPPGLLIGRDRELLHVVGAGRDFLDPPQAGPFTTDVVKLAKEPLRIPLATGVERALRTGEEVVFTSSNPDKGEGKGEIVFRVIPLGAEREGGHERLFVAFGQPPEGGASTALESVHFDRLAEQRIAYLEDALRAERENLQSMLEQLETSNEELQSTNEELMTANEELQSTNEELHSVNEELYTVNAEYERKNEELTQLSKDVSSLLQATGVGVVFVDRGLLVRRFTPTATRVVNLIPGDEGRHLSHITHKLTGFDFCAWLDQAMASGELTEEERAAEGGQVWTVRAAPVKDGRSVSGAVVSLIEVSRLVTAEAEARARSAELRQLLDWVGAVSLQFCAKGLLLRGSGDWEAFTGRSLQSLRQAGDEGWLELIHPEDAPQVAAAWTAAHETLRPFQIQARMRRPGGDWRPVAIDGGPQLEDDRALGWFLYVRDAAEAAGARADAAVSDRRAQALAEIAFAGTYAQAPKGRTIDLDARLARLIGLEPGPTSLAAFEKRLSPPSRRQRAAAIAARRETGGRWTATLAVTLADGRRATFRDDGLSLDAAEGGELLVGALTPIEAQAEEAALALEVVRSSPVEVIEFDPETLRILKANPAAARNLGYGERDLTRMEFVALLPQFDAAAVGRTLKPLLAGETTAVQTQTFALRRDGSTYDVALSFRALAGGARIASVGRDVSERRRIEETLRRRTEALARSNRDLEQFAFLASHDLISPLRRIAGRAELLRERLAAGDAGVEDLDAIETLTARLQHQVTELLAFARSNPKEEAFEDVDLSTAAQAAAAQKREAAEAAGGMVEIGALPTVKGSPALLQLVFENLIENALRYRAAGRAPQVRIDAQEPGVVTVADNGRGFDPSRADELFEPSVRLSNDGEGAGMGLAICRRVMEAHGGSIAAESRPGEGAVFRLRFPTP
ncbi:MAG: PAS domain S-box protein [Rhodobacteraceae bacterium]|nr:MAG: PAS domain S-box protein [Paracoccaceae bacterium]